MRKPLRALPLLAMTLVLSSVVQLGTVPQAALAARPADPLPRAYRIDSVAEVPDLQVQLGQLALSADGDTALHLSPRGDDPPVLVATDLRDGGEEVVGLDLEGLTVPQVLDAAISGDGRTVAFVASGSDAADLRLPADADPFLKQALFVRDRLTGATAWVRVPDLGVPASHHRLENLALSADGRRLAVGLSLPLPEYDHIGSPEGVLLVTLAADAAPVPHVVRPEDLVGQRPDVRNFALSGDGKVLAVNVESGAQRVLLRFDAASGDRLPGERELTQTQHLAWFPNLDQSGRRTAFGGVGAGVVVADLVTGPSADVTLEASAKAPYVSGDAGFAFDDLPATARLSADGATVAFRRSGALWAQPAQAGRAPALASPGLDGRIADPVLGESTTFPDFVNSWAISGDAATLAFMSMSTAFTAPRTDEPQPSHLYRAVPADAPAPSWPQDAALTAEPGTTSVALSWPAASATVKTYDVSVNGAKVATVTAPATQATPSGLTPGSTVEIAVVARDADGRASAPLTTSVTLLGDVPPGEAPLSAVAGPGARVRLQWEASDTTGLTGYRVLRDGVTLADLAADATSYDDTTVAADTTYTYAVAVLRGAEQLRLTKDAQVRVDRLAVTETAANLPKVAGSTVLALGREATFALVGAAGFTATADLVVRTADDPAKPVTVPLAEERAGRYRGSWPLPEGVTEIVSGTMRLADGAGHSLSNPVTGLPATVGGLARVGVTVPGGEPDGVRLQVWSGTTGTGYVTQLKANGTLIVPVVPAPDYVITTRRSDGLDGTAPRTVTVASGQAVDVTVAPHAPASLTLTLRRPGNEALAEVPVVLTTRIGPRSGRTDGNGRVTFGTLDAGTGVTAKITVPVQTLATYGLAAAADRTVTLVPGDNALAVTVGALPEVTVRGTVKDDDGRPLRAAVTVRQTIGGVGVPTRVETAADGTWSAQVFGGGTRTVASATRARQTTAEAEVDPATPVELVFPDVSGYVVRPKLVTVSMDGDQTEQFFDTETAGPFQPVILAGGRRIVAWTGEVPVDVPPGSTVTFCADGAWRGLSKACAEVVTGDSPDVPVTVEIRETSRITARILEPDGTPRAGRTCSQIDGEDTSAVSNFAGPGLRISAPAAGTYVLTVVACKDRLSGSVQRLVTVAAGEQLDLGDLRLGAQSTLIRGEHSGFGAVTDAVLPGGLAHLRADIEFQNPTRSGSARLTIPPGVTVPDDAVLRDGKPVAVTREGNTVVIPLPAARTRTVDVYVRAPGTAGGELPFSLAATSDDLTEHLGSAGVRVGMVTLLAPASSQTGRFIASGLASAGARVVVRDGDTVIAEADAGDGGRWNAIVDLGAGDEAVRHVLRAAATVGTVELASDPVTVVVDPYASTLETVTMSQTGVTRTFHPADGVARFPWVWNPSQAVTVRAEFSGPVGGPRARLGTLDLPLTPVAGQENVFSVTTKTQAAEVGDLTIAYAAEQDRPLLPLPAAPGPADGLFDPQTAVIEAPVTDGDAVSQEFTVPVPKLGPAAQGRFTLIVEPLPDYEPDADAIKAASASGVPVYGPVLSGTDPLAISTTGRYTGEVAAIVDIGVLRSQSPNAPLVKSLNAAGFVNGAARVVFRKSFWNVTNADSLNSAWTGDGKYADLNTMMNMANKCNDGAQGDIYRNALKRLMQRAIQLDVYNGVSAVVGLALAPATFGLGTVAVWAVTWGIGKAMEVPLNNDIEALRRQMNSDQDCRWPERDTSYRDPHGPRPDADIDYRFDPSGYLYEGLDERRVAGVTATLLRASAPEGPWQVYDASVYGDLNPQITDDEGRYGWDVPEGWWKVVYTKNGYLPAESRALKVLPPHTDVDVSLLRADLAEVDEIEADGEGLTVTMTQPTRVTQALSGALTVTTADGASVGGQWTAVSPQLPPAGHPYPAEKLAMKFRFTGEKRSGEVKVVVDPLLQDHGGRAVADGVTKTLDVRWSGPDAAGPQVGVTGVADGATYRLHSVPAATCVTVDRGSGVATQATLTLTGGTPAGVGVYTATCAGAKDNEGNVTAPVSANYKVVYVFTGFAAPVKNDGVVNTAKAGQGIQIKWRLTDAAGAPVNGLTTAALTVSPLDCQTGRPMSQERVPAEGASQLQVLGNGSYQVIWRTPASYLDKCLTLHVDAGEGAAASHTALFRFTRNESL
ncbi:PxKF domain-containing protein [Herbidospora mongoliensis]|uniref:PxKF domain-containing protein n=1 Tax=Herbidospora mongoliensis TaxID=688067 RepID=UPI000AE714CE|nr:PxKF domain-containing protein [Herbidospora mongoliensis]